MRKIIALILIATLASCTLKPAPITTMDVKGTLEATPEAQRREKAVEIQNQIEARKRFLKQNIEIPTVLWIISPITTAIVWLCFTPAREESIKELKVLDAKATEL